VTLEPVALAMLLVFVATLLGHVPDWRVELGRFQLLMLVAFAAYALALMRRARWHRLPRGGAFVVLVALAMRAAVFPATPSLSDDVYRYAWEGRVLASGGNPYAHAPNDPALAPLRDRDVYPHVNHPELRAIYPPLAEGGFGLVARAWDSLIAFKLWVLLHDLALCAVLAWWCAHRGGSAWDAIAYAWNPLVVVEYAGSAHHDPTGILWLVVALAWAERRPVVSALSALASVMVKLVTLPALPFLARAWPARVRGWAGVALGAAMAAYVWLARGPGSGLEAFAYHWRHNESVFGLLAWAGGERGARIAAAVLVAGVMLAALWRRMSAVSGTRLVLRSGLLLGPVLHPWYLGWVLALEPLGPSPAWLLLSCTVLLGYGSFAPPPEGGAYHPSVAWRAVEYGLPCLLAVATWRARERGRRARGSSVRTLS
jgi:hypothetical protein